MSKEKVKTDSEKIIGRGRKALRYGVNIFVYFFVAIFMLFLIFFGISQTQIFKDWLRDTVVQKVNSEINGKLYIDKIEGTIFTSLKITNANLISAQNDTVVSAENIELKTSPLKILFKEIYIRKFELSNTKIKLVEESDGILNLLKIFPPSAKKDTTSSEFPFAIEVADFKLNNIDFSLQKYDKVGSDLFYPSMNMDDLRISNLNVSFSGFADLNEYVYRLTIDNISFNPNFEFFKLNKLSGTFLLTPKIAGINKLHIVTDQSDFTVNAGISDVDLLGNFSTEKLGEAPVRLSLDANKINFDDISTYVPEMNMLSGTIAANLDASGTLDNLSIKKLELKYNNTSLEAIARLKGLINSNNMFIDLTVQNSYLAPEDPSKLIKNLVVPDLTAFGVIKLDTLTFIGNTNNFKTRFTVKTEEGNINGSADLNFTQPEMNYNIKAFTQNLNLSSLVSINTILNSKINVSGTGTNPQSMKMQMALSANDSKIGNKFLKKVSINLTAANGLFNSDVSIGSDSLLIDINSNINFKIADNPTYELKGSVNQLNLGSILQDTSLASKINLTIDASGQGFNPDSMDLFLVTDIKNSHISEFNIDSTRLILDVRRNDNGKKIINIVSDIADFTISGSYNITTLSSVLERESKILNKTISQKFDPIFLADSLHKANIENYKTDKLNSVGDFNLDYLLDFKESLVLNLGSYNLQIDGQMQGNIESLSDSLSFSLESEFNYLKFWNDKDVFFMVDAGLNCKLGNHLIHGYQGNTIADVSFNSKRLYANTNFYDIAAKINFNGKDLLLDFVGNYEDLAKAKLNAMAEFNENIMRVNFKKIELDYNKLRIYNSQNLVITYSDQIINFEKFYLNTADGTINFNGSFGAVGDHKVNILIDKISGEKLIDGITELPTNKKFKADIKIVGVLSGNFYDPIFTISGDVNNIYYANSNFGSLKSKFDYKNNSLKTDIRVIDSVNTFDSPKVLVTGFIPLALTTKLDSVSKANEQLDLTIQSFDFDLGTLGNLFPYVQFKQGKLQTDIYVTGKVSKPSAVGYFTIKESRFKVLQNNLDYDFDTKIWIDDEVITVETVELKNIYGTKYGGTLKGDGIFKLKNFIPDSSYVRLNGDLKVLDNISKSGNPYVYGDLALKTRGDIVYYSYKGKSEISLPIDVTVAELTVPLSKTAYTSSSGFVYRYKVYNTEENKLYSELDSLIQLSNKKNGSSLNQGVASKFDYTVDIKLDTEAEVVVVLSKELDQNLSLILGGDFYLQSVNGITKSGGALQLLEGSKISFIKSFEATGTVSFEKLNDPIIDIVGVYKGYYYPTDENNVSTEQEVAVKIKLKGPLSELNKNFMKDENNIGVYVGKQAIEEDKKDPTKTTTDAFFFIITGNFSTGATQQEKNAVASTATSLAGSVLGGFLNQYLGDYVKSVQLRQVGTETKFSLIGKAGKFKYEIGGSTDVFQDLSRANIKIEYPITQRLQLKLERKESENQLNSINNPLFNQFGIKYNFEF